MPADGDAVGLPADLPLGEIGLGFLSHAETKTDQLGVEIDLLPLIRKRAFVDASLKNALYKSRATFNFVFANTASIHGSDRAEFIKATVLSGAKP